MISTNIIDPPLTFMNTGYHYAPYVPLITTPAIDLQEYTRTNDMASYAENNLRFSQQYWSTPAFENIMVKSIHIVERNINWLEEGF